MAISHFTGFETGQIKTLLNGLVDDINDEVEASAGGTALLSVADVNALPAIGTVLEGKIIHVDDLNANFQSQDGAWVQVTSAYVADLAAATSAYAKASGAYRVQGRAAFRDASGVSWMWHAAYNATTNRAGALTAGFYPVPGELVGFTAARNATVNLNNATAVAGFGTQLFTAPSSPLPFTLASTTYSNDHFTVTQSGDIKVLREGLYDIDVHVQAANVAVIYQTYLVKNQSIIDNNATNTIAGQDLLGNANAATFLNVSARRVRLLTTDTLRVVLKNAIAGSGSFGPTAMPASAALAIRWAGVTSA